MAQAFRNIAPAWLTGALLAACSVSPQNNSKLIHKSSPVSFTGITDVPNHTYYYRMLNNTTGSWDYLLSVVSGTTIAGTDSTGVNWYEWSSSAPLYQSPQYWADAGQHQIKAVIQGIDSEGTAHDPLVTFDYDASLCLEQNATSFGAEVKACKSSQSPNATVFAPCGTTGEACCMSPQPACDAWNNCTGTQTTSCTACGSTGQACCGAVGAAPCQPNNKCAGGTCVALAPLGGACTALSDCASGATSCSFGVCTGPADIKIGTFDTKTNQLKSEIVTLGSGTNTSIAFTPNELPGQDLTILSDTNQNLSTTATGDQQGSYWTCLPQKFNRLSGAAEHTVTATATRDVLGQSVGTAIRYVHGSCSFRADWKQTFFNTFSATVLAAVKQQLNTIHTVASLSLGRDYDFALPQFTGSGTSPTWGFFYEGKFEVSYSLAGIGVGSTTAYVAPGYSFAPGSDGYVQVKALTTGVSIINDTSDNSVSTGFKSGLHDLAPQMMHDAIAAQLQQPVAAIAQALNTTINTSCSPTAALSTQQSTCFNQVKSILATVDPKGVITAQNFSCVSSGTFANQCAFHPIVQAVNVLPDSLELVFSPSASSTTAPDDLGAFYQVVDAGMRAANAKAGNPNGFHLCSDPYPTGVQSGGLEFLDNGSGLEMVGCSYDTQ
jgi:hypothetical protein